MVKQVTTGDTRRARPRRALGVEHASLARPARRRRPAAAPGPPYRPAAQLGRDRFLAVRTQRRRYAGATSLIASPIRWMRRALVEPGMPGGEPAMITTWSPSVTRPILSSASST